MLKRIKIINQWVLMYGVIAEPSPLIEYILTILDIYTYWIVSTVNAILLANSGSKV